MARRVAYVTLLTTTSYLSGVLVLDHTLRSVDSAFPLIVMATPTLPQDARGVLARRGISIRLIESLRPPGELHSLSPQDARFADTWTKLRAFELVEYERIVLLDADMIVMRNMDELFDIDLPSGWIAAAHVCACNPRKLQHYPDDWVPENCAYTPLVYPSTSVVITEQSPRPYTQLNSGLVVLDPSLALAERVQHHLYTSPLVSTWLFPDQDLLSDLFGGRWKPLPWYYNALKTLMLIHKPLWRDEEIRCLHYILADKPWHAKVSEDDTREFAKCNRWWWDNLEQLSQEMKEETEDWKLVLANVAQ